MMRTSSPVPHLSSSTDSHERHAATTPACGHARAWLHEFVDGALDDSTWIAAHLNQCDACERIAQQLRAQRARLQELTTRALDANGEHERAPASLVARVRAAFAQRSA